MNKSLKQLATIHYGKSPNGYRTDDSDIPVIGTGGSFGFATKPLFAGPLIVVARKGTLGKPTYSEGSCWVIDTAYAVIAHEEEVDTKWLYYNLNNFDLESLNEATGVPSISRDYLYRVEFPTPSKAEQRKIAKILTTVDNLIEKAEALIAKYQTIKQGMMHNLFTRGVDEHDHLRPPYDEAPNLYKQSKLGWIPREWDTQSLGAIAESLIDGPFGSNLKTEHYVPEPGVRVVRLQNIEAGRYSDDDRAFVSERHAASLSRHEVVPGDVLIASLGEETHPVGRACIYPNELPPAINKADCFRLRCKPSVMLNTFAMFSFNTAYARTEIDRLAQGVTRVRVNVQNLKQVKLKVGSLLEQAQIVGRLEALDRLIEQEQRTYQKLLKQKTGLMQDLLSGKVRVKVDEAEEAAA
jgi:type I restriction enzyme S subunit